jgi:hypothetical protein
MTTDGFDRPTDVTELDLAFPGAIRALMPPYYDIPKDFRGGLSGSGDAKPWRQLQAEWMFVGITKDAVTPKTGIDVNKAWQHLSCVQRSFEPKHQHKEAAVAWLMSRWFDLTT